MEREIWYTAPVDQRQQMVIPLRKTASDHLLL